MPWIPPGLPARQYTKRVCGIAKVCRRTCIPAGRLAIVADWLIELTALVLNEFEKESDLCQRQKTSLTV